VLPAEVTFQTLPPAETGTRFSDPRGMQGSTDPDQAKSNNNYKH